MSTIKDLFYAAPLIFVIAQLVYRIAVTVFCVNRARYLNRSTRNWGIFAFIFPIFALVAILFMKDKVAWQYSRGRVN